MKTVPYQVPVLFEIFMPAKSVWFRIHKKNFPRIRIRGSVFCILNSVSGRPINYACIRPDPDPILTFLSPLKKIGYLLVSYSVNLIKYLTFFLAISFNLCSGFKKTTFYRSTGSGSGTLMRPAWISHAGMDFYEKSMRGQKCW